MRACRIHSYLIIFKIAGSAPIVGLQQYNIPTSVHIIVREKKRTCHCCCRGRRKRVFFVFVLSHAVVLWTERSMGASFSVPVQAGQGLSHLPETSFRSRYIWQHKLRVEKRYRRFLNTSNYTCNVRPQRSENGFDRIFCQGWVHSPFVGFSSSIYCYVCGDEEHLHGSKCFFVFFYHECLPRAVEFSLARCFGLDVPQVSHGALLRSVSYFPPHLYQAVVC